MGYETFCCGRSKVETITLGVYPVSLIMDRMVFSKEFISLISR